MKFALFNEHLFRHNVDKALGTVQKILDTTRNPTLAQDQDHQYQDKFDLAALLTNTFLLAYMNVLERLGLTSEQFATLDQWVHENNQTVTLRLQATQTCEFVQHKEVDVEVGNTHVVQETSTAGGTGGGGCLGMRRRSSKTKTTSVETTVTTKVQEYHWNVGLDYQLMAFAGADPESEMSIILQRRQAYSPLIIKGTEKAPFAKSMDHAPIDLNLTFFLKNTNARKGICQFVIDRSDPTKCKTPRRNEQIDQAVQFAERVADFSSDVRDFFVHTIEQQIFDDRVAPTHYDHQAKLRQVSVEELFYPILPLMDPPQRGREAATSACTNDVDPQESLLLRLSTVQHDDSPLLSQGDLDKFLQEQIRTLEDADQLAKRQFDGTGIVSHVEASLVVLSIHGDKLAEQYQLAVEYIEHMLKQQLIAAIGKEMKTSDLDEFMSFHYQHKLYGENYAPTPFCYAIRRPGHYPDGILSIESADSNKMEPIETFTKYFPASDNTPPIRIPLNAAATAEFTGDRYLHGWIQHRFSSPGSDSRNRYQLVARARQFSCFLLMVGTVGPDSFDPQDAIILQNKDEVLIPLLLNELPTAKDFKDAIVSLSPEQQRFAKSFREMQLESSVFGVCVIQLKPQLEDLLNLPQGALTKEIQLTQDLLSLFIDYQIPSDLLSYDGPEDADKATKLGIVKEYAKSVLDVIKGEKDKQLEEAKKRAEMAEKKMLEDHPVFFSCANDCSLPVDAALCSAPAPAPEPMRRGGGGGRNCQYKVRGSSAWQNFGSRSSAPKMLAKAAKGTLGVGKLVAKGGVGSAPKMLAKAAHVPALQTGGENMHPYQSRGSDAT